MSKEDFSYVFDNDWTIELTCEVCDKKLGYVDISDPHGLRGFCAECRKKIKDNLSNMKAIA